MQPGHVRAWRSELATKYLAGRRFKKASTKELHEQIIKRVLLPRFRTIEAVKIGAKELKNFFLALDVSDSTRGKYRAVMSQLCNWGISEELIPEFIEAPSGGYVSIQCLQSRERF